jgi:hypothetical protein
LLRVLNNSTFSGAYEVPGTALWDTSSKISDMAVEPHTECPHQTLQSCTPTFTHKHRYRNTTSSNENNYKGRHKRTKVHLDHPVHFIAFLPTWGLKAMPNIAASLV